MKTHHGFAHVLLLTAALTGAPAAFAHAMLRSATPARNAQLTDSPAAIRLTFSEKLESSFSNIVLLDSSGKRIDTPRAVVDKDNSSVMQLTVPHLGKGKYTVQYVVVGDDGHRRKGSYSFSLK